MLPPPAVSGALVGSGCLAPKPPGFFPAASPLPQPLASPLHETRLAAGLVPAPPRAFPSGFIVTSRTRQGRDGGRGGGVRLCASSHNLCLTNLPPEGLRGAAPTPASPHPSSSPSAPSTQRWMAVSWGGGRERGTDSNRPFSRMGWEKWKPPELLLLGLSEQTLPAWLGDSSALPVRAPVRVLLPSQMYPQLSLRCAQSLPLPPLSLSFPLPLFIIYGGLQSLSHAATSPCGSSALCVGRAAG